MNLAESPQQVEHRSHVTYGYHIEEAAAAVVAAPLQKGGKGPLNCKWFERPLGSPLPLWDSMVLDLHEIDSWHVASGSCCILQLRCNRFERFLAFLEMGVVQGLRRLFCRERRHIKGHWRSQGFSLRHLSFSLFWFRGVERVARQLIWNVWKNLWDI